MILLIQIQGTEDDVWNDMQIPPNRKKPPVRGEPVLCETPDEIATLLVAASLEGVYRLVLDNGEMWQITVKEETRYVASIKCISPIPHIAGTD